MLKDHNALALQFPNLGLPVLLPVADIRSCQGTERTACPDCALHSGIEASVDYSAAVRQVLNRCAWYPYAFFATSGAADSLAVTKRVPTQTASAPSMRAEATLRPSNMPPAATSRTCWPVIGDLYCLHTSAQAGMRTLHSSADRQHRQ